MHATQCPIVTSFQASFTVTGAKGHSQGPRGSDTGGVFTVKFICQVYVHFWRKSKREGGGDRSSEGEINRRKREMGEKRNRKRNRSRGRAGEW